MHEGMTSPKKKQSTYLSCKSAGRRSFTLQIGKICYCYENELQNKNSLIPMKVDHKHVTNFMA